MEPCTDLAVFRSALKAGAAPESHLRKQYVADQIKALGDRKYTFTISTQAIDRDRDTLKVAGWKVKNYLAAGGPVLWAHQSYDLPIGKAESVVIEASALKARMEFAPKEANPLAENVMLLVDFGALKATSVGFLPVMGKATWNEQRGGIDFEEQELLEFSIVPVPSNPEALLNAKSAGIDCVPVRKWCEAYLDGMEPGLWLPKASAEAAFKALSEPRVVVPATFDPGPFVEETKTALTKRGRVLSAANEASIRSAADGVGAASAALGAVLAQLEQIEEEGKGLRPDALERLQERRDPEGLEAPIVVRLAPAEPRYSVSPEEVVAAVNGAVARARGRLD